MSKLILASTSPYRRELLARLGLEFKAVPPSFDEEAEKTRAPRFPADQAAFLAHGKAQSLAGTDLTIIGGDQLIAFENEIIGKAGSPEGAALQLHKMSGKKHELLTAVCVLQGARKQAWVHSTTMHMRELSNSQIAEYICLDRPWDTAGSYKFEKHGVALFEKVECDDFTAIQGLPLLELSRVLIDFGFTPFEKES